MPKSNSITSNPLVELHFIVFIFGFTGILGHLIDMDAVSLTLNRMVMAFLVLWLLFRIRKVPLKVSKMQLVKLLAIGGITAAHWITFFHAIKISNVSVTLSCLASTAFMVSILEPIVFKRKVRIYEMVLGLLVVAGLYVIFRFNGDYTAGILVALSSAFLAAVFSTFNGKIIEKIDAKPMAFYEMLGGVGTIALYSLFVAGAPMLVWNLEADDIFYLLLLGTVCTAYPMVNIIKLMKKISPYSISLAVNMEPVYGIIMAVIFFSDTEKMDVSFYIGTLLILTALFLNAYISKRIKRKKAAALKV